MKATINVKLEINSQTYNIALGIPSGNPTDIAPYQFSIASEEVAASGTKPKIEATTLLELAVGAGGNFYVNVEPPADILPTQIETVSLNVSEGTYADGKFATTSGGGTTPPTDTTGKK